MKSNSAPMRLTAAILALLMMSAVAGCWSKPANVIPRECLWGKRIDFNAAEALAINDCCPYVAEQLLAHNEKWERECQK